MTTLFNQNKKQQQKFLTFHRLGKPMFWIQNHLAVFRIRISFHADLDPGSQKCPYGSKEVNTKKE